MSDVLCPMSGLQACRTGKHIKEQADVLSIFYFTALLQTVTICSHIACCDLLLQHNRIATCIGRNVIVVLYSFLV